MFSKKCFYQTITFCRTSYIKALTDHSKPNQLKIIILINILIMKTRNILALAALFEQTEEIDDVPGLFNTRNKSFSSLAAMIMKTIAFILVFFAFFSTVQAQKIITAQQNILNACQAFFPYNSNTVHNSINNIELGYKKNQLSNDLQVTISVDKPTAMAGSNVIFKVTALNNGATAVADVIVSEILPSGYSYISYKASDGVYNIVTGEWEIDFLEPGDAPTLLIIARVNDSGTYLNTVTISSAEADPDMSNNSASVTVTPSVGLPSFAIGTSSSRCQDTGRITYSATAANTTGITYSIAPLSAGSINATTGEVIWNELFSGTANIAASAAGINGPSVSQHTVTVTAKPTATISYGGVPYCKSGTVAVILTGQTGGSFSANTGLSINASTGEVDLGASTPGTYEITYNFSNNGCNNSTKATIVINDIPSVTVTNPAAVCNPSTIDITTAFTTAGSTAGLTFTYFTNAAATNILSNPTSLTNGGTYYIKGTNAGGCSDVKPVQVIINTISATLSSSDNTVVAGNNFTLTTNANSVYEITAWIPSPLFTNQTAKTQTIVLKDSSTTFSVVAVSENGCKDTASVRVMLAGNAKDLFIPNAFTPNRDGNNDVFKVYGSSVIGADIKIYTQWGAQIFETNDNSKGWDGTSRGVAQPVGVYIYVVKVRTSNQDTFLKKGTINLIR